VVRSQQHAEGRESKADPAGSAGHRGHALGVSGGVFKTDRSPPVSRAPRVVARGVGAPAPAIQAPLICTPPLPSSVHSGAEQARRLEIRPHAANAHVGVDRGSGTLLKEAIQ